MMKFISSKIAIVCLVCVFVLIYLLLSSTNLIAGILSLNR